MDNLEPYLDRFSASGRRVLERALSETLRRNHHFISPEHILYALMNEEPDLFDAAMRVLLIDIQDIRLAIEKRLDNIRPYSGKGFRIAPETTGIFKYSMDKARSEGHRTIEASDICSILSANKYSLLDDVLKNPDGPASLFHADRIGMATGPAHIPSGLKVKPSEFFARFSLKNLVDKNTSPSGLFCANRWGGIGAGTIGGNSEQTTHSKHESLACWIRSEDSDKFDEVEFVSSLRKDLENSLIESNLKITGNTSETPSSFRFEYENRESKGQIDFSGELRDGYYELNATTTEKSI